MTHPSADLYDRGIALFGEVVAEVPAGTWDAPSPCEGWTALDVLGHLGTTTAMGLSLLRGEQPSFPEADRPADLVQGEPVAWWTALAAPAKEAIDGADLDVVMDTPMGPRTVADRLAFPAIDLFVHAWDIGKATGVPVEIPEDLMTFAHGYIDPFPAEMVRGEKGAFGPEAPVPDDATPTEVFVAWTGRTPR